MANVYTPDQAYDAAKLFIAGMPLQDVRLRILDDACAYVWMAAPWRWTLGSLVNIPLTSSTVDYSYTSIVPGGLPADFLYVHQAWLSTAERTEELNVEPCLPSVPVQQGGDPTSVCLVDGTSTFRVYPGVGTLATAPTLLQTYKKVPPRVGDDTAASSSSTLVMPDAWFHVYVQAVRYFAYVYAARDDAGQVEVTDTGQYKATGQFGILQTLLTDMRKKEKIGIWRDNRPLVKGLAK